MSSERPSSARPSSLRVLIGKLWLEAFGWEIEGGPPDVKKAVVVACPHTSGWDLPFTLAVSWALGIQINWIGKHTLFKPPFGGFFKFLGGVPVNRTGRNNAVQATAELLEQHDDLLVIIAPEGTRGKATRWKTGFYYIALTAKVPIVLGFLDYEKKRGGFGEVFHPSGDIEADWAALREFYKGVKGKHPDRQGAITLGDDEQRAAAVRAAGEILTRAMGGSPMVADAE
jgi:1-acyl-sn-glycerol-3-phosphate acyltransferase